jgi:hypothetical protein
MYVRTSLKLATSALAPVAIAVSCALICSALGEPCIAEAQQASHDRARSAATMLNVMSECTLLGRSAAAQRWRQQHRLRMTALDEVGQPVDVDHAERERLRDEFQELVGLGHAWT